MRIIVLERAAGRLYNAGEAEPPAEAEWVRAIARVTGWNGKVAIIERGQLPQALRWPGDPIHHLVTDTTRIRSELGYAEGTAPDEALRRTVAWERANPPEQIDPASFDYAEEDAGFHGRHTPCSPSVSARDGARREVTLTTLGARAGSVVVGGPTSAAQGRTPAGSALAR
ncbi:MAG TPA: hypothetical protein VIJ28_18015 [Chloroflexota bacterium]